MKIFDAHERLTIVKALQARIVQGWTADNALNDLVSSFNGQNGLTDADPLPVHERTNMAAIFDLYEAETGETIYTYEAAANGKS